MSGPERPQPTWPRAVLAAHALALALATPAASMRPPVPREDWALLVGVDHAADDGARLSSTLSAMALVLRQAYGYPADHVQLLLNQEATQASIRTALARLARDVGDGDSLLLFVALPPEAGGGAEPGAAYLVPFAGKGGEPWTLLLIAELDKMLLRASARTTLLVLPGCAGRSAFASSAAQQSVQAGAADFGSERSVTRISYCTAGGESVHAAIASAVLDALKRALGSDLGRLSAAELQEALGRRHPIVVTGSRAAADGFAFVRTRGKLDPFIGRLAHGTIDERAAAIRELVNVVESEPASSCHGFAVAASDALRTLFVREGSAPPVLRDLAIRSVGSLGDLAATDDLVAVAGSAQQPTALRGAAFEALARLGGERALASLRGAFEDPDPAVRAAALRAASLVRSPGPAQLALILAELQVDDEAVRIAALQALPAVGTAGGAAECEAVLALAGAPSAAVRGEVLRTLGRLACPAINAYLSALERDPDAAVRQTAAEGLGEMRSQAAVQALIARAGDASADVRRAVYAALGAIGDPVAVGTLFGSLRDELHVREAGARALTQMPAPTTREGWKTALDDGSPWIRAMAVTSLAAGGLSGLVPRLIKVLADEDPAVRQAASDALAGAPDADVTPLLIETLASSSSLLRQGAATVLGRRGAPGARAALLGRARAEPLPAVRSEVLRALGRLDPPAEGTEDRARQLAVLLQAARDEDAEVRAAAAAALKGLASPEGTARLQQLTRDPSAQVRESAVQALAP